MIQCLIQFIPHTLRLSTINLIQVEGFYLILKPPLKTLLYESENHLGWLWKSCEKTMMMLQSVLGLIEKVGWYLDDGSDGAANGAVCCNFADKAPKKLIVAAEKFSAG